MSAELNAIIPATKPVLYIVIPLNIYETAGHSFNRKHLFISS